MRSMILPLALILFAGPVWAQDEPAPLPDEAAQLCYAWSRNSAPQLLALLKPAIREGVSGDPLLRRSLPAIFDCFAGALENIRPEVNRDCVSALDPSDRINIEISNASDYCFSQAATKPTVILPGLSPDDATATARSLRRKR